MSRRSELYTTVRSEAELTRELRERIRPQTHPKGLERRLKSATYETKKRKEWRKERREVNLEQRREEALPDRRRTNGNQPWRWRYLPKGT
jgi:hypothetical protein